MGEFNKKGLKFPEPSNIIPSLKYKQRRHSRYAVPP